MNWKLKRKTTHVKIYYKDGSVYNLRRALVLGSTTPSRLRIKVTSNPTHRCLGISGLGIVKSFSEKGYSINKTYVEKVEQTYKDGSVSVVFDQVNGLKLDAFMMML